MTPARKALSVLFPILRVDQAVRAIAVSGSLARNIDDEFSDLDLICLVHPDREADFLARRLDNLSCYRQIIASTEVFHIGPQILCIFDDGLQVDLFSLQSHTKLSAVKVLHDPEGLFADFKPASLQSTPESFAANVATIGCVTLEFERAWRRGQSLRAVFYARVIASYLTFLSGHVFDPEYAQVAHHRIDRFPIAADYQSALMLLTPATADQAVRALLDLTFRVVAQAPHISVNQTLLSLVRARIAALPRVS